MIKQHAFSMRKTFVQGMLSMMKDSYSTALPKLELIEVSAPCKNVYHICLNQPNSRNAFTLPMWRELKSVIDFLANNPKCRSIVISGAGKSFCAGIDLKDGISEIVNLLKREDLDVARKSRLLGNIITVCQDSFTSLEKCPKPVIAAIHGHCIGAGINLIAATDIRYASLDAVFSIREVALGIAADVGILNRINKIVGNDSLTRELAYTGRNIGCSEALKYGIISRKFLSPEDCVQASLKLASEIATLSPIAVQGTKFTLNYSRDHGVDDSMNFIRAWNQSQLQSDDLASSFLAFTQKEPVEYGDVRFAGHTAVITGASRGIGKEIALKLAKDGANIVVAAKTSAANPKLPGTIHSSVEEIEKAGGRGLACAVDVRDEESVQNAVESAVKRFGGIDILINNASAISLTGTLETTMKRFDLMHAVNTRGTFLMSRKCIPYLKQGKNPHILNISPPLVMEKQWFANHVAYTMAKYGMSMCVLGMHEELRECGIAVNALWPRSAIWTAAMDMLSGGTGKKGCRKPEIMADAAYSLLSRSSKDFTGNFVIDDDILKEEGVRNFDRYAYDPNSPLTPDFFLPEAKYFNILEYNEKKRRDSIESMKDSTTINEVLSSVNKIINAELVRNINAIYQFRLESGVQEINIYLDLKNGEGSIREGVADQSDVQFALKAHDFARLFNGDLNATTAFMTGRLKIKGSMSKAMQMDSMLKKLKKDSK